METAILASYRNGLPLKFDIEFKPFRLDPTLPVDTAVNKVRTSSLCYIRMLTRFPYPGATVRTQIRCGAECQDPKPLE